MAKNSLGTKAGKILRLVLEMNNAGAKGSASHSLNKDDLMALVRLSKASKAKAAGPVRATLTVDISWVAEQAIDVTKGPFAKGKRL